MAKYKEGDRVIRVRNGQAPIGVTGIIRKKSTASTQWEVLEDSGIVQTWDEYYFKHDLVAGMSEGWSSPFPEDSTDRKTYPIFSGVLNYFPAALAAVAHHSYTGNEKHNPGQPLQHARGKSGDHKDCAVRHLMESELPGQATAELTAAAWRVLAALQEQLEKEGKPVAPAATF